jgi:hypothetical protein
VLDVDHLVLRRLDELVELEVDGAGVAVLNTRSYQRAGYARKLSFGYRAEVTDISTIRLPDIYERSTSTREAFVKLRPSPKFLDFAAAG